MKCQVHPGMQQLQYYYNTSPCVVVVVPSDPLLPRTVLCFSYFFLCVLLFFPFFIAQKMQDFLRCSSGWGFGVLGGGVLGGGFPGGVGGCGRGGIIAFVCVCVLSFRPSLFFITVVSVFFLCAKTLTFLFGAFGFVIFRAAWIVSVTFGFFGGGF